MMAVHESGKPDFSDSSEDDDGPAIFKRSSTASKQSQSSSSAKTSQKSDGPLKMRTLGTSNCQNSSLQKNKVLSTSKVSTEKYAPVHSNSLTSKNNQSKNPLARNSSQNDRSDDSDDDKPLGNRLNGTQKSRSFVEVLTTTARKTMSKLPVKDESPDDSDDDVPLSVSRSKRQIQSSLTSSSASMKAKGNGKNNADDEEDEKPLLCGLNSTFAAGLSGMRVTGVAEKPPTNLKQSCSEDDPEDEKPLLARFHSTSAAGSPSKKATNTDRLPLTSNLKQNGANKRPSSIASSSLKPSVKKAKVSGASPPVKVKKESIKEEMETDDNDHKPISQRMKEQASSEKPSSTKKVIKKVTTIKKNIKKMKKVTKDSNYSKSLKVPPGSGGGQKWSTLEHNGLIFPPPYKLHGVKMLYNGQRVDLTPEQEEVATMFAVMKDTDYATKPKFIENFWNDWKQLLGKNHIIKKFELCDFTPIYEWHLREKEKKKQMSSEEKKALKEEKLKQEERFMWAIVDGVKEKVGNFRVEPPGLFRGRGEHPKMGKLKKRILPKDITINIGNDAPVPECPLPGERWKEIRHDNTVTWLAYWNDPINPKEFKYVFLAASSTLKGQSDREKYEKARLLKNYIHNIRANYTKDFTNKDPMRRQIAVATYLIDKLALRAGNEKDDDEADTVGCCTLKVENVTLVPPNKIQFDFLGKDSIRYFNTVVVELPVYKAIGEFQAGKRDGGRKKSKGDDLFDLLDTSKLNTHLKELMPGLTAKVFRTYNASITLDGMLNSGTKDGSLPEKIATYQAANKEVAIICNHQRSVSKSHESQMSKLNEKIDALKAEHEEMKVNLSRVRKGKPPLKDGEGKTRKNMSVESLQKKIAQIEAKIEKMELEKKTKEDLKTVALGTSKINYLDPRITVAWCKRNEVPIEKIFNKSLLAKFAWSMDVEPDYRF